uniref:Uncharacterized protein n=1 Tax=Globodera rostochiensis TaxID=31243 RepID=A0A914HQK1_GLORO
MNEFWNLILVSFLAINSLDKTESVQLEETPFKIIDEIFGEGWWNKDKAVEWHKLTLEHGQIEPNSTDQNPPLTESDHSDNAKNGEEQNEMTSNAEDERKPRCKRGLYDISAPDICGPDICGPDIYGPDICGPDISAPDICGPDIYGPDICGPDICGPDIYGPDICGSDFCGYSENRTFAARHLRPDQNFLPILLTKFCLAKLEKNQKKTKHKGTKFYEEFVRLESYAQG